MFHRPAHELRASKTRIRETRRDVRSLLGTSNDPPPTLDALLHAARELARAIDLASSGRYGLATVRSAFPEETTQTAIYRDVLQGLVYGETLNTSSQVHEPIAQTIRVEQRLRTEQYLAEVGR